MHVYVYLNGYFLNVYTFHRLPTVCVYTIDDDIMAEIETLVIMFSMR
jgi:hypothetical protein